MVVVIHPYIMFPQACWIRGLYTYDGMDEINGNELRYYGIPKQLQYDGRRGSEFCRTDGDNVDTGLGSCEPMHKIFYRQYQWFPFYMGAIALLYYVPYIFYR